MLDTKKCCGWIVPLCDPAPIIDDLLDSALRRVEAQNVSITMALVDELAERRRRPMILRPIEMAGIEQFGCWLTDKDEQFDFIFYESHTAAIHQEHIILHELSHIMLGHRTYHVGNNTDALQMALMRTTMRDSVEEQEAEQLANLLQEAILNKVGLEEMLRRAGDSGWSEVFGGMRLDH